MDLSPNEQMLLGYIRSRIAGLPRAGVRQSMLEDLAAAKRQLASEGFSDAVINSKSYIYEGLLYRVLNAEFGDQSPLTAGSYPQAQTASTKQPLSYEQAFSNTARNDIVLFFKPNEPYGFLSNWWPAPINIRGTVYPTTEHHMMVMKALLMGDQQMAQTILNTASPASVKGLGKKVKNFDVRLWDAQKANIVFEGNLAKFTQHPDLARQLLNTGDNLIAEASPYDKIWGIGLSAAAARNVEPARWKGQNLLGQILIAVRSRLRG
jgi:ribA/ribD-fused uncharacterized protein